MTTATALKRVAASPHRTDKKSPRVDLATCPAGTATLRIPSVASWIKNSVSSRCEGNIPSTFKNSDAAVGLERDSSLIKTYRCVGNKGFSLEALSSLITKVCCKRNMASPRKECCLSLPKPRGRSRHWPTANRSRQLNSVRNGLETSVLE